MRGEKECYSEVNRSVIGSSPHARGKVTRLRSSIVIDRIIPACAGKRQQLPRNGKLAKDHPRMRGEKSFAH